MTEQELREAEEALKRIGERCNDGRIDPLLISYVLLENGQDFDPRKLFEQIVESMKYDGPERRRSSSPNFRPVRDLRRISERLGKSASDSSADTGTRAATTGN